MNPVVGLGLAQPELQAVHRLQRIRLLIDQNKEQLVCHLRQDAVGAATDLPLAPLPLPGLVWPPGSPIFKAVQKKWCTAWCRALKKSPKPPESAVGEGSEPSDSDRSGGAP